MMPWNIRFAWTTIGHLPGIVALLLSVLAELACSQNVTEIKSVSQCFSGSTRATLSPLLTLYCGHGRRIIIRRIVQGSRRRNERSSNHVDHCGFLDGDCLDAVSSSSTTDDERTFNFTNRWTSSCDGRHFCVEKVGPAISGDALKTTDTESNCESHKPAYLMVMYECVLDSVYTSIEPALTSSASTSTGSIALGEGTSVDLQAVDICSNYSGKSSGLTMISPGYPHYYPEDTDCRCIVRTKVQSKVSITYKDIELTMTEQRDQCIDWLLLQSIGHGNSAAITCGHLFGADRVIASRGSQMLLHFHTASRSVSMTTSAGLTALLDDVTAVTTDGSRGDETPSMKGFKIFIQADPPGEIRVNCHLTATDISATSLKSSANANGYLAGRRSTKLYLIVIAQFSISPSLCWLTLSLVLCVCAA